MWNEIERLRRATVGELRTKYLEMFGQPSRSNHKQFLFRRIAWRLQAVAYGELSEQARQRALARRGSRRLGNSLQAAFSAAC